jgi:predicted CoA-binding protein
MSVICQILNQTKTIAVVDISDKLNKDSRRIALFLKEKDFIVAGINPNLAEVEDIMVYPSLRNVPFKIDIVNVFRRSETIPELITDVLYVKPKVFWLQLGISNNEAVKPLIDEGITVIQDKCILVEYLNCYHLTK